MIHKSSCIFGMEPMSRIFDCYKFRIWEYFSNSLKILGRNIWRLLTTEKSSGDPALKAQEFLRESLNLR